MSISLRKIQWIVAGAALVLAGALAAGTWFRADSAEVGDQRTRLGLSDEEKLVRTELLPNVPGKRITVTVVSYAPGEKSGSHPRKRRRLCNLGGDPFRKFRDRTGQSLQSR
jgi:hypothetical protein